jgi:hypothetical protein
VARVSQVIVLAEDERQQRFVRYYLRKLSYTAHDIRLEPLSSGRGSGEAWVRTRYPPAVEAYRARSGRAQTSLVVAIDADTRDITRRARQLEESLASEGRSPRAPEERIAHLIPRRNIETWILNLNGNPVDEETDFHHAPGVDDLIDSAAQTLFEWTRPNAAIPAFCVPSLRFAIPEIRRLEHRP